MQDFRSLKVWTKGHELTLAVYTATKSFPKDELFGLTSQLRRCSASIPANIAEGCGRGSDSDFGRFLQIAMGSASELEYHLLLSRDLGYVRATDHESLTTAVVEVKRMLATLLRRVKTDS
jgi:four helix bundle protein